jgi:hypothetical protein
MPILAQPQPPVKQLPPRISIGFCSRFDGAEALTEDGRILAYFAEPTGRQERELTGPFPWDDELEAQWRDRVASIARAWGAACVQFDPGRDQAADVRL